MQTDVPAGERRSRAAAMPTEVLVSPRPFDPTVERIVMPHGLTVAQLLEAACNKGCLDFDDIRERRVRMFWDGLEVDIADSLDEAPPALVLVNIVVEPLGGGNGGSKILQAVLQIALLVVAGPIGGAIGGALQLGATATRVISAVASAAVVAAGGALIQKAFAPEAQPQANAKFALSDQSNQARPRQPMPLVMGKRRWAPDVVAKPYTETWGDDVYMTVALGLHYGPCVYAGLKIGETLAADLPAGSVQIESFLEPGPRLSALMPGIVDQQSLSAELDAWTQAWSVQTLDEGAESFDFDIACPGGLGVQFKHWYAQTIFLTVEKAPVGTEAWQAVDSPVVSARTHDPVRQSFNGYAVDPAVHWKVRIKAHVATSADDRDSSSDKTFLTAIRSRRADNPFVDPVLSVLILRFKSSDQLTGQLPIITAEVTPKAPVWDPEADGGAGAWTGPLATYDAATWQPTSDAVALTRYLLGSYPAARPLTEAQLEPGSGVCSTLIAANDWHGSVLLTDEMSQEEAIERLKPVGRFSTYWNGQAVVFVPDWAKPVAKQLFTGRNVQGYRWKRAYPTPVHAVIVEFENLDEDTQGDDLTVYMDGFAAETAELYVTVRLGFACVAARAFKEGRVWLAKYALLVENHEWTCGADGVIASYGDRVKIRHHTTLVGLGEARVVNRFWVSPGGLVSGLRLDAAVPMDEGKTYGLTCRTPEGLLQIPLVTTPGANRTVTFAAPVAEAASPARDDLVAFGETGLVTEDVELVDLDPGGNGQVGLQAIPYIGPAILAAETGPIPELTTTLSARPKAPAVRILQPTGSVDGAVVPFDIAPLRGAILKNIAARWRIAAIAGGDENPWVRLPPLGPNERVVRTPPVSSAASDAFAAGTAVAVDVEIRSVITTGDASDPSIASGILLVSERPTAPKANAWSAIGTSISANGGETPTVRFTGECDNGLADEILFEVKAGADWRSAPTKDRGTLGYDFPGLAAETIYTPAVSYIVKGVRSDRTVLADVVTGRLVSQDTSGLGGRPTPEVIEAMDTSGIGRRINAAGVLRNAMDALREDQFRSGLDFQDGEPVRARLLREEATRQAAGYAEAVKRELIEAVVFNPATGLAATRLQVTQAIADIVNGTTSLASVDAIAAVINHPTLGLAATRLAVTQAVSDLVDGTTSIDDLVALEAVVTDPATGLAAARAALTVLQGVIAGAGNLEAYWKVIAAAGPDPAYAELVSRADGSIFRAVAKEVFLGAASGGVTTSALRLLGNRAILTGNLLVEGRMRQSSGGAGYLVAMESFSLLLGNNDVHVMSETFGAPPLVQPDQANATLDPLAAGERYDFGTKALSAGGFTAKVEIITPGAPTLRSTTGPASTPGTGPALQRDKPTIDDAADGNYEFQATVEITCWPDFDNGIDYFYNPSVVFRAFFNDGSVWVGSDLGYGSSYFVDTSSGPKSLYVTATWVVQAPGPIGQHGGLEFGVSLMSYGGASASVTGGPDFDHVTYTTLAVSSSRSATPSGQKLRFIVTPRNAAL